GTPPHVQRGRGAGPEGERSGPRRHPHHRHRPPRRPRRSLAGDAVSSHIKDGKMCLRADGYAPGNDAARIAAVVRAAVVEVWPFSPSSAVREQMADAGATRVAEQLAAPALSAEEREEILTARNFVERHGGFAETGTTLDRLLEGQAAVASRPQRSQAVSVERCVAEQLAAPATERISAAVRSALKAVNFGAYSYHELMMGSDRLYASVERCVAE